MKKYNKEVRNHKNTKQNMNTHITEVYYKIEQKFNLLFCFSRERIEEQGGEGREGYQGVIRTIVGEGL